MANDISIRRAVAGDAAGITEVFLGARATMTWLPRLHTDDETRAFIAAVVAAHETYVAERDARIVGFAALREDWLDHLYIHPAFFGRKMGMRLLDAAKRARPAGFRFWVFQQNTGARRFYERHGAKAAEFTDGGGNEEKLPDIRYEWTVQPRP